MNDTTHHQQRTREEYAALEARFFGNQTGDVQNGMTVKLCIVCGALAANPLGHAVWHDALERLLGIRE